LSRIKTLNDPRVRRISPVDVNVIAKTVNIDQII